MAHTCLSTERPMITSYCVSIVICVSLHTHKERKEKIKANTIVRKKDLNPVFKISKRLFKASFAESGWVASLCFEELVPYWNNKSYFPFDSLSYQLLISRSWCTDDNSGSWHQSYPMNSQYIIWLLILTSNWKTSMSTLVLLDTPNFVCLFFCSFLVKWVWLRQPNFKDYLLVIKHLRSC